MVYRVFQFFPNLGIKVRITEHQTKEDAYETINICRNYAEVPYIATDRNGKIFDMKTFGLSRRDIAHMLEELK